MVILLKEVNEYMVCFINYLKILMKLLIKLFLQYDDYNINKVDEMLDGRPLYFLTVSYHNKRELISNVT